MNSGTLASEPIRLGAERRRFCFLAPRAPAGTARGVLRAEPSLAAGFVDSRFVVAARAGHVVNPLAAGFADVALDSGAAAAADDVTAAADDVAATADRVAAAAGSVAAAAWRLARLTRLRAARAPSIPRWREVAGPC